MLSRLLGLVLFLNLGTLAEAADRDAQMNRLIDLLAFERTIEIMHDEGLRYGADVARDMMPESDPDTWRETVNRIYDTEKMLALISRDFREELAAADIASMLAYFETADGQQIVDLELAARRAFLDPETEQAAIKRFLRLQADDPRLIGQVEGIIDDSDLVEFNVMGSLNASLMFYRGLNDGGLYDLTEEEMLADVWAQEDEVRRGSREWLGAFLTLAYQPLEASRLEGYANFYRTPAGRELNRAIFASFDRMYEELSYLLGLAVAEHLNSQPL